MLSKETGVELDELLILAGALLPQFFSRRNRAQQAAGNMAPVIESLAQQFLPKKGGEGFNEEVLLAEISTLLEGRSKEIFDRMTRRLERGEKQFFAMAIATFAAKYQKGKKQTTQKTPDGKDSTVIESLEPLTADNPAIIYLNGVLSGKQRPVDQVIEDLRNKGLIRRSAADVLTVQFKKYKKTHGDNTEVAVRDFLQSLVDKLNERPKQKVDPFFGLYIAFCQGRLGEVEVYGSETVKRFLKWSAAKLPGHKE